MACDGLNDEEELDAVTPSFDARKKETMLMLGRQSRRLTRISLLIIYDR